MVTTNRTTHSRKAPQMDLWHGHVEDYGKSQDGDGSSKTSRRCTLWGRQHEEFNSGLLEARSRWLWWWWLGRGSGQMLVKWIMHVVSCQHCYHIYASTTTVVYPTWRRYKLRIDILSENSFEYHHSIIYCGFWWFATNKWNKVGKYFEESYSVRQLQNSNLFTCTYTVIGTITTIPIHRFSPIVFYIKLKLSLFNIYITRIILIIVIYLVEFTKPRRCRLETTACLMIIFVENLS